MFLKLFASASFFTLLLSASLSEARAARCENLFDTSVQNVLTELNTETGNRFLYDKDLTSFSNELSWNRRRQLRKHLQNLAISEIPSEKALENHVVVLGNLLFGRLDVADRWLLRSADQRRIHSAETLARRELLHKGLLKTWNETYDPQNIARLKKVMDGIWRLQNRGLMQVLGLPFFLPGLKDQRVSHELMYKMIRDGFDAHAEEIRVALHSQSKVEAYNTFRRLYSPVFMGLVFIVLYETAQDEVERERATQVAEAVRELRSQKEALVDSIRTSKTQILQEAWEHARNDFIVKWGEPPTPEEEAVIKAEIKAQVFLKGPSEHTD